MQNQNCTLDVNEENLIKKSEKLNHKLYKDYVALINKKMEIEKMSEQVGLEYIKKFGEKIDELLSLQIKSIKYQKLLSLYYQSVNNMKPFSRDEALRELAIMLKPFYDKYDGIKVVIDEKEEIFLSDEEIRKIKKLYKEIVKKAHPDVHPEIFNKGNIATLFHDATTYYKINDYEKLEEVYVLIMEELEKYKVKTNRKMSINNIDKKLKKVERDIKNIVNSYPYLYIKNLSDDDAIENENAEFDEKIEELRYYVGELENDIVEVGIDLSDYNIV